MGASAWYVPSMYELMTLYGYNFNILSPTSSTSGAIPDVIQKVYIILQYL